MQVILSDVKTNSVGRETKTFGSLLKNISDGGWNYLLSDFNILEIHRNLYDEIEIPRLGQLFDDPNFEPDRPALFIGSHYAGLFVAFNLRILKKKEKNLHLSNLCAIVSYDQITSLFTLSVIHEYLGI